MALACSAGCEKWITGYGPQPSYIEENEHVPLLNAFGVLRPGTEGDKPLSFLRLEGSFPVGAYPDTFKIMNADVTLFQYDGDAIVDSLKLTYTDFDGLFPTPEYRHPDFFPMELVTYGLSCRKEGYPELTATTTMPAAPVIVDGSMDVSGNRLEFSILRDRSAAAYDIELMIGQEKFSNRVRRPETGNTLVQLNFIYGAESEALLVIYAYDSNLSEYISANIGAKPNTYQPSFSTVDNGCGCFGSLNLLVKTLTLPS